MPDAFSADEVFFTVLGYDMSYLEFFGTLLNLASVLLVVRRSILTWPIGIAAVVLFGVLFYQIELYSDVVEQVYFFGSGFYGWWVWSRMHGANTTLAAVETMSRGAIAWAVTVVAIGTVAMGAVMANVHRLLPSVFPEAASLPYLDALTTVMSFVAQALMAHRKLESWLLWIAVDVIGIGLYYYKDVAFISLLYGVFLVLAVRGFFEWRRSMAIGRALRVAATETGVTNAALARG
jgi:nicotinamide mononucleotide transporter